MSQQFRSSKHPARTGGIDRTRPINFSFDGKPYQGYHGDTLASALLANGVTLMGRSFKYHRPRGLLTAGSEEPNAIVELRSGARQEPNTRATMIELFEGLQASSQNRFPSLKFDLMSVNQYFGRFLTAGFYYKTFMWPASFWEPVYEKIIRRSAGLGKAATLSDPDRYEHSHMHADVVVVGAGPAGISAALSAGRSGARVLLVEELAVPGGALNYSLDIISNTPALEWVTQSMAELDAMDNVTVLLRTALFGYYDGNVLAALERVNDHLSVPPENEPRQRMWTLRSKQVVLCCGAQERPMVFANNDKPGVMMSASIRRFFDRYGVMPGQKIALCTTNDDAYVTAKLLHEAGVEVAVIADARSALSEVASAAANDGFNVKIATLPASAGGGQRVSSVVLVDANGSESSIACDSIGMSGGFSPDVHLSSQSGALATWNDEIVGFVPGKPVRAERSAGASRGSYDLADCLAEGHQAGTEAASLCLDSLSDAGAAAVATAGIPNTFAAVWQCPDAGGKKGKCFVDFQNDVTAEDIRLAHQEGYVSVEHTKRYTTLGMATDQGKTANVNGLAILAEARNQPIPEVGTTRFRPPYSPVAIAAFAGHERGKEFQPIRYTAMHKCHEKLGAVFVETGQWLRPQFYPKPGEGVMECIYRESEQVRKSVGVCDVSTLGKIEIFGSDTAEFLNRLYINGWLTLQPGKARYGLMLREDGYVFDDGTTSCLAEDHYFMTTTTANAARVLAHMEHASQVLWPEMDVTFCSATEQWCGVAVAGPNARATLAAAFADAIDLSDENVPFMGVREFDWNGAQARIFRISFSGEQAFEVNVPWAYGEAMWNSIWEAGQSHDIIPYGTEALSVLRIEKGHVAGNELDGRTTAADMGMGRMMSTKKPFIGLPMTQREGFQDPERATLVGIKLSSGSGRLRGGAHLVEDPATATATDSLGWVTSVCDSPQTGCWIGLAYLKGGLQRYEGKSLSAWYPLKEEAQTVEICHPVFFDPEGGRLRG